MGTKKKKTTSGAKSLNEEKVIFASVLTSNLTEISSITGVPISSVARYRAKNSEKIKELEQMRDSYSSQLTKEALREISENLFMFLKNAAKTIADPDRLEAASLRDIMTAFGIIVDKFPELLRRAEEEEKPQGVIIEIVDNSLDEDKDGAR